MEKRLSWLTGFLLASILVPWAAAEVVDLSSPPDRLLDTLGQALDSRGIDVRRGRAPSKTFTAERPQLTKLSNFPELTLPKQAGRFPAHFKAGALTESYLVAVDVGVPSRAPSEENFQRIWNSAAKKKRVFLSFAREDLEYAEKVQSTLEAKGYVTFLYLDGSQKYPKTNAVQAGTYFKQAGTHLVIDTGNARRSSGVIAEAKTWRLLHKSAKGGATGTVRGEGDGTVRGGGEGTATGRGDGNVSGRGEGVSRGGSRGTSSSTPCCKLCHYRNGILIGCGPVECGPQCYAARPPFW